MIYTIVKKEITTALRNRSFLVSALIMVLLMCTATIGGYRVFQQKNLERIGAEREKREQWLHQDAKHPHMAAHFGNFAYVPSMALSLFDYGLNAFTGTVVYLEPHKQNDFSFKPAEEQSSSLRFGELSLALILQLLLPLIIIFNCFSAVTMERENGTLQLLYSQGVSFKKLFAAKFIGYGILVMLLCLPAFLLLFTTQLMIKAAISTLIRIVLLAVFYFFYLLLFVALSLMVSAYSNHSKSAVLCLLVTWIAITILIPKWAVNAGDNLHPLPSKYDFVKSIHDDIARGIDGHDPSSSRAEKLKLELLKKYNVDTVSKLPFNFEGYLMQAGEEYSSKVYDKHFAQLQNILASQNQISLWSSLIDPFIAMKNISMALSGTDYYTHLDFQRQAEWYRRSFVQQMNEDMERHSKFGDWEYKINSQQYARVPEFQYVPPSISQSLSPYLAGFGSMILWGLVIMLLIGIFNRQTK